MSLSAIFLPLAKRENSTRQPTQAELSNGVTANCVLMDDTSLMNPTLKVHWPTNAAPHHYNYCYISDFGRYYFVSDVTSSQGFWYFTCICDVLATYKTAIGSSQHYVLRSASASDPYIIDTSYITKASESSTRVIGQVYDEGTLIGNDPFGWDNGHSYVLGVISPSYNYEYQFGAITYYWLSASELTTFLSFVYNNIEAWSGIATGTYSAAVQQALLNPMQYVASCIALPFNKPSSGPTDNTIYFGYYHFNPTTGFAPIYVQHSTVVKHLNVEFTIAKHPQASSRGIYMNSSPYTSYTLHLGPFGDIPLDPALLVDESVLSVDLGVDVAEGAGRVIVKGKTTGNILYHGSAQVGVRINMSQYQYDPLGQTTNLMSGVVNTVGAAGSAAMGNISALSTAITTPITTVENAMRLKYPTIIGGGEAGSFLTFHDFDSCYLNCKFYWAVEENQQELGRPLYAKRTINTLSGFILCTGADVLIAGTQEESIKVNTYLNTGFYYE